MGEKEKVRQKVKGSTTCLDGQTESMRHGHQPKWEEGGYEESMDSEGQLNSTEHTDRAVPLEVSDHVPKLARKHRGAKIGEWSIEHSSQDAGDKACTPRKRGEWRERQRAWPNGEGLHR